MIEMFFILLQMSLSGSFAVFYLFVLRALLRKIPKSITYFLWGLVAFHLIFVSVPIVRYAIIPQINLTQEFQRMDVNWNIVLGIYLAGVLGILLVNLGAYLHLSHSLARGICKEERMDWKGRKMLGRQIPVYYSNNSSTAFTLGFFPPRIYLPVNLQPDVEEMVLCHEMVHIQRGDYLVKMLAFLLCTLNWFNPFLWVAFYFFVRDQESSCDEMVLQKIGLERKKQYAETILNAACGFFQSGEKNHAMPFGEANIKYRIQRCVNFRKWTKRQWGYMGIIVLGLLIPGIFVSSLFQINRLPFLSKESPQIICGVIVPGEKKTEYQMRGDGIYRVDEGGETRIYHGSLHCSDCFYYKYNGLFFMTENARDIRYLDLDTNQWQKIFRCGKKKSISSFLVHSGFVRVNYSDGTVEEIKLCLQTGNVVSASDVLLNPGRIYHVTQWEKDGAHAYLDIDLDGSTEDVFLDIPDDNIGTQEWEYRLCVNGETKITETVPQMDNEIYASSVDGKHIYLILMTRAKEPENVHDITTFYRYEESVIQCYGEVSAPVSLISFSDGQLIIDRYETVLLGEGFDEIWFVDEEGRLVKKQEDSNIVKVQNATYELQKELNVHQSPGSSDTFCVPLQRAEVKQFIRNQRGSISGNEQNGYWVELVFADGTTGWIFSSDGKLENGDDVSKVFSRGVYIHSN